MPINTQSLKQDGFTGFRPLQDLDINRIPQKPGIFAVLRPEGFLPQFLARSTAGIFKKKNPSLKTEALDAEWVDGADARASSVRLDFYDQTGLGNFTRG